MSKAKKKTTIWYSKKQSHYVINSYKSLSSEIQLYELKDEIKFYKSIKPDRQHTLNTIKLFNTYSTDKYFQFTFINKVKNTLRSVAQYDVIFNLEGKNHLYHTYKLLGFIRNTVSAYLLSNSKEFTKGTIAEYDYREKGYYLSEYLDNRKQLFKSNNPYKGVHLINAFLYRSLYLHRDFTKYYLGYFAIFGVDNMKLLDNNKLESKIIKNILKVFQSGKVTKQDCAKSLLSTLYYYLVFKMRIVKKHALSIAKNLVHDIFNIYSEYKGSEILKNIYVKEVIGSFIVYSFDTKKEHITSIYKNFLEDTFMTHTIIGNNKFPTQMIQPFLNNPLQLSSLLTPSELLQKI